jgi:hypothetical protein
VTLLRPALDYRVVTSRRNVTSWAGEIYRDAEPIPVPVKDENYSSRRLAELAGNVAPREILEALARDQDS